MKRDKLIVLSGGMDSVTMLHEYHSEIALAVTFNYGSNHNAREVECARYNCKLFGIELIEIDLKFIAEYFKSALLSGADAIPLADYDSTNIKATVVPFRNGIMLAAAAGIAESRGLKKIMLANHAGDHAIYPDCRPGFISAMSEAISQGTCDNIEIFAPYTLLTKAQIAARGKTLGVDYTHTYSCYRGEAVQCGQCATCRERRAALAAAGIEDLTPYQQ